MCPLLSRCLGKSFSALLACQLADPNRPRSGAMAASAANAYSERRGPGEPGTLSARRQARHSNCCHSAPVAPTNIDAPPQAGQVNQPGSPLGYCVKPNSYRRCALSAIMRRLRVQIASYRGRPRSVLASVTHLRGAHSARRLRHRSPPAGDHAPGMARYRPPTRLPPATAVPHVTAKRRKGRPGLPPRAPRHTAGKNGRPGRPS
jgi:hypothetical protein